MSASLRDYKSQRAPKIHMCDPILDSYQLHHTCKQGFSDALERHKTKSFSQQQQPSLHIKRFWMHLVSYTHIFIFCVSHDQNSNTSMFSKEKEKKERKKKEKKPCHRLLKIMCQNLKHLIDVLILLCAHPSYPLTNR